MVAQSFFVLRSLPEPPLIPGSPCTNKVVLEDLPANTETPPGWGHGGEFGHTALQAYPVGCCFHNKLSYL
jgi:hypothetical protein